MPCEDADTKGAISMGIRTTGNSGRSGLLRFICRHSSMTALTGRQQYFERGRAWLKPCTLPKRTADMLGKVGCLLLASSADWWPATLA